MIERIEITTQVSIDRRAISYEFIRSSGPGGQHVNKVSTAVQLRFDIRNAGLSEDVIQRLHEKAGNRINSEHELIIEAKKYRSQLKNKQDALERLIALLQDVAVPPKIHKPRRGLSRAAKHLRLEAKRKRSEIKQARRRVNW
ncbi:aminoacyl-tRNA hydrolase [candidate division KSB1 bacterium]|nr:aminoacyl-tRNA hydrolase [candidate division KSB1 bacterium]